MKKHISIILLTFLLCGVVQAGVITSTNRLLTKGISLPKDDAADIIRDIIAVVGLKANFTVMAANIDNAAALIYNGKRYIAYNPQFITRLNSAAGNKWASVSVLAHEIGHHLNGHTLMNTGSQPALELEADEFSGFVLQKMGATLAQAQMAMKLAADYKPSLTHPGKEERLLSITKGWNNAGAAISDMAKYNKPIPQTEPQAIYTGPTEPGRNSSSVAIDNVANNTVLDSRYVLATVDFPSDRQANYYVTTRYNLVKVTQGRMFVLGKMYETDSKDYPFVMVGDATGTLYVDRSGKIVTSSKQVAGYFKVI